MSVSSIKPKKKRPQRPVYFQVRRMVDPRTGEEMGALVPRHRIDQRLMRERNYCVGDELRADLKKPRNPKLHRLVHGLGGLVVDQIEAFHGLDCHAAIKKLQRDAGVCCDIEQIDAAPVVTAILAAAETVIGATATRMLAAVLPEIRTIDVMVPQSIAFDAMDEGAFYQFWQGICRHICDTYWPDMDAQGIEAMISLMPEAA